MLIRLTPEQVVREWEVIRHAIKESTYESIFSRPDSVRDHLRELIAGTMQAWAIVAQEEFVGIVTTRFSLDASMGVKRLEIYSLFGFRDISPRMWATCYVMLKRFALANDCTHIIALSDQEHILSLATKLGGDTTQRMIVFDL